MRAIETTGLSLREVLIIAMFGTLAILLHSAFMLF